MCWLPVSLGFCGSGRHQAMALECNLILAASWCVGCWQFPNFAAVAGTRQTSPRRFLGKLSTVSPTCPGLGLSIHDVSQETDRVWRSDFQNFCLEAWLLEALWPVLQVQHFLFAFSRVIIPRSDHEDKVLVHDQACSQIRQAGTSEFHQNKSYWVLTYGHCMSLSLSYYIVFWFLLFLNL